MKIWWKSGKIRGKSGNQITFRKTKSSYYMREVNHPFCEEIWRFDENPEKSGKRIKFQKTKSFYHIWIVKHSFCQEICSKLVRYEDLSSVPLKKKTKKEIFKLRSFAHQVKNASFHHKDYEGLSNPYINLFYNSNELNRFYFLTIRKNMNEDIEIPLFIVESV